MCVLHADRPVFVLGPRYEPANPGANSNENISRVCITSAHPSNSCTRCSQEQRQSLDILQAQGGIDLYMMMGRELSPLRCASAGNVIGIGRLGKHVLKTATLASTPACYSLTPMKFQVR